MKLGATPAWCLWCSALSVVILLGLYWVMDERGASKSAWFVTPAGENTPVTYVAPDIYYAPGLTALAAPFSAGWPGAARAAVMTAVMLALAGLLTRLMARRACDSIGARCECLRGVVMEFLRSCGPPATRRTFLGATLAAALTPAAGAAPRAQLRFGLATYEWGRDWDITAILANLTKAGVHAVELKTLIKYGNGRAERYPHGVELELSAAGRQEVKKRFADSPVTLVSLATSEHSPWPDAAVEKKAIEDTKGYVKLSHDVGSHCVRVLPNIWLPDAPREKTFDALAAYLNAVGGYASELGQEIALEAHGGIGELRYVRAIMDRVTARGVRVRLNSEKRNTVGEGGIDGQFSLIRHVLSPTMHIHNLKLPDYPYQEVIDWLVKAGWDGWAFLEVSDKVPDRVQALAGQRELWEKMVEQGLKRTAQAGRRSANA